MLKRKFQDFAKDSDFKFWGIVISRFVWGYSRAAVADKFECSESYVTQVMKKFEADGGHIDHRQYNSGSHFKVARSVKKILVNCITKKPNITSPQLVDQIANKGYHIADRTVRNIRQELGFEKIKPNALPALTNDTQEKRLKYCEERLEDKFSNTCFSDESVFQLAPNKQVLWYRRGEDDKPHLEKPNRNKKIMVWGGISRKGQTPIKIYRLDEQETVTAESYVDCLREYLFDSMDTKFGINNWRFVQDNARPHVAKHTMEYLDKHKIKLISHPPYSPDLNPIEKVWAWMKQDICQTAYDDVEELMDAIEEKWLSMSISYQNSLIDHHIKVIEEVYNVGGQYLK